VDHVNLCVTIAWLVSLKHLLVPPSATRVFNPIIRWRGQLHVPHAVQVYSYPFTISDTVVVVVVVVAEVGQKYYTTHSMNSHSFTVLFLAVVHVVPNVANDPCQLPQYQSPCGVGTYGRCIAVCQACPAGQYSLGGPTCTTCTAPQRSPGATGACYDCVAGISIPFVVYTNCHILASTRCAIFFVGTTLWVLLHYDLKQIGLYGLPAMPCEHTVSLICVSKAFFPMCHRQVFPININCMWELRRWDIQYWRHELLCIMWYR
jgi:hypothetical protein